MRTVACLIAFFCALTCRADVTGTYVGSVGGERVSVKLQQSKDGSVAGLFSAHGTTFRFSGKASGNSLSGSMSMEGEQVAIAGALSGSTLNLKFGDDSITLTKEGAAPKSSPSGAKTATKSNPAASNKVIINGSVLSAGQLASFGKKYGIQLPPGSYWYDKKCGAWGVEGSPTLGITKAGVDLGGSLKQNASRGNTGVFVNGRELPLGDVAALQGMGVQVVQGRWSLDAQGNVRREGTSAVVVNLYASGGGGGGGAYQRKTAGGYIGGDGKTSYFFDPKSGSSVMVGN